METLQGRPMIKEWLDAFMLRHMRSLRVTDFPEASSQDWFVFRTGWLRAFINHDVTEPEADDASMAMVEDPPRFCMEHLPALLKRVEAARIQARAKGSRDLAAAGSNKCPYCSGSGLRLVFAPLPDDMTGDGKRIPESVAAYCICPYGRHVMNNHQAGSPDVFKRTPGLRRVLNGRSYWRLCPHGTEPDEAGKEFDELAREFRRMAFPSHLPAPAPSQGKPTGRKR